MAWFWNRPPRTDQAARKALKRLSRNLAKESQRQIVALSCSACDPDHMEPLFGLLKLTAEARLAIGLALQRPSQGQAEQAATLLSELAKKVTERLGVEPWRNNCAWQGLSRILVELIAAQESLIPVAPQLPSVDCQNRKRRVVVDEALLQECYHSLFPAERMLVVAGRHMGDQIRLTDVFDVTGNQSGAHVRADPDLLRRALIEMEQSESFLAAWLHSHPGWGPGATHPSPIDLRQDCDWHRDFPHLLNVIVVEDLWVRFWGIGLESGQIEIEIVGRGIIKENGNGYLIRLEEQPLLPVEPAPADATYRHAGSAAAACAT